MVLPTKNVNYIVMVQKKHNVASLPLLTKKEILNFLQNLFFVGAEGVEPPTLCL